MNIKIYKCVYYISYTSCANNLKYCYIKLNIEKLLEIPHFILKSSVNYSELSSLIPVSPALEEFYKL